MAHSELCEKLGSNVDPRKNLILLGVCVLFRRTPSYIFGVEHDTPLFMRRAYHLPCRIRLRALGLGADLRDLVPRINQHVPEKSTRHCCSTDFASSLRNGLEQRYDFPGTAVETPRRPWPGAALLKKKPWPALLGAATSVPLGKRFAAMLAAMCPTCALMDCIMRQDTIHHLAWWFDMVGTPLFVGFQMFSAIFGGPRKKNGQGRVGWFGLRGTCPMLPNDWALGWKSEFNPPIHANYFFWGCLKAVTARNESVYHGGCCFSPDFSPARGAFPTPRHQGCTSGTVSASLPQWMGPKKSKPLCFPQKWSFKKD